MRIGSSLLILSLVVGGCGFHDPVAYRQMADYFPIEAQGNWWLYTSPDGKELYLEVVGDSVVLNRGCKVLERDYKEEYWWRGEGQVAKYIRATVEINAQDIVIEERWRPHLEFPLVLGNSWEDEFRKETYALGDTILREVDIEGKVVSREPLSLPAGDFEQCYRVEICLTELTKSRILGDSFEKRIIKEWYGGDVGLLRVESGGEVWELESYEVE